MNVATLIEQLGSLGLSTDEAGIYVHLTMAGPSKASDIATACRMRRPEAYRVLQNLVQRGFVAASLGRPARFQATPPEQVFSQVFAVHEAAWERLVATQTNLLAGLEAVRGRADNEPARRAFRLVQGRPAAVPILERMLREATSSLRVLALGGPRHVLELGEAWSLTLRRAEDGLPVQLLGPPAAPLPRAPEALACRLPAGDLKGAMVLADDRELLLWMVTDPSARLGAEDDVVVWSDAPDLVAMQVAFFDAAFQGGRPANLGTRSDSRPEAVSN
jgi:hypothetical protein